MTIELKVPAVGESITEVQIGEWRKNEGDIAEKDENLVEIETDKATVELSAPVKGKLAKVLKHSGDTAAVGEVIGYMEEAAAESVDPVAAAAAQAQAADMIRTPAKRLAESPRSASDAARPVKSGSVAAQPPGEARATSGRRPATNRPQPSADWSSVRIRGPRPPGVGRSTSPSRAPFPSRSLAVRGAIARKKPCR